MWMIGDVQASSGESPPLNIVLIFIDDMGYADIGPFGAEYPTPHLDRLAEEGRKFTDFLVTAPVCSSSRAAILTGCYNRRLGISGAYNPRATAGLNPDETTIAELCKEQGYATACFGKWHLGHHPKFLPLNQGFDEYLGLPYSNDMWPFHPKYAHFKSEVEERKKGYPPLPLIEGNTVINREMTGEDQAMLTTWYTERAVNFIERNKDRPFFLYVPHSMVHVPLFVSEKHKGKSGAGLYGDVVMELDWSVGEIIKALKEHGLEENTLVIFTSDNGPWLSYGEHAGSAGPLREGKGTSFEGGVREPTIFWWPGKIPAGTVCESLASTIDILPTVASLIGAPLPAQKIDGKDIIELLVSDEVVRSPHESFALYYYGGALVAVRNERFKLVFPHTYRHAVPGMIAKDGTPVEYGSLDAEFALYDLDNDIGETTDVKNTFPEAVRELQIAAARYREQLGDKRLGLKGTEIRPAGQLKEGDEKLVW